MHFKSLLNKITPEKFEKLSIEFCNLRIRSPKVLKGIIVLILDKALNEPSYSALYAQLCQRLDKVVPNFETTPTTTTAAAAAATTTTTTTATPTPTTATPAPASELDGVVNLCTCLTIGQLDDYKSWLKLGVNLKKLGAPSRAVGSMQ